MNKASQLNADFWNDLCGSALARKLGVYDSSIASLARYDEWYFDYYDYLLPFIDLPSLRDRKILEVGLGYGSLSNKIAASCAEYTGLDIASGPVQIVNHRLSQHRLNGRALQGSVLECPFPENTFDSAIAIGSLHHTGNLALALRELHRCIIPGGSLIFMVYNAFSYRRWLRWPIATARHALWTLGMSIQKPASSESERAAYDTNSAGQAAPETAFVSRREVPSILEGWSIEKIELHNVGYEGPLRFIPRKTKLALFDGIASLDLYVRAKRM